MLQWHSVSFLLQLQWNSLHVHISYWYVQFNDLHATQAQASSARMSENTFNLTTLYVTFLTVVIPRTKDTHTERLKATTDCIRYHKKPLPSEQCECQYTIKHSTYLRTIIKCCQRTNKKTTWLKEVVKLFALHLI